MFGRYSKLAIYSLSSVNIDDLHVKRRHVCMKKLLDRLHHSYRNGREKAIGTSDQQKAHYVVKTHASHLVRNVNKETTENRRPVEERPSYRDVLNMTSRGIHPHQERRDIHRTCYLRYGLFETANRSTCTSYHIIVSPFTYIINLPLIQGVVPDDLKSARVPPFKKQDKLSVGNYKPVSV